MLFYFSQRRALTSLIFEVWRFREHVCLNNPRKKETPKLNIPSCLLEDSLSLGSYSRNLRKLVAVINHRDVSLWQLLLANRTNWCLDSRLQNKHHIKHYWAAPAESLAEHPQKTNQNCSFSLSQPSRLRLPPKKSPFHCASSASSLTTLRIQPHSCSHRCYLSEKNSIYCILVSCDLNREMWTERPSKI